MWIFLQTLSKETHVWSFADVVRIWTPWSKGVTGDEVFGCNITRKLWEIIGFGWGCVVVPSSMGLVAFESWIAALRGDNSTSSIHVV